MSKSFRKKKLFHGRIYWVINYFFSKLTVTFLFLFCFISPSFAFQIPDCDEVPVTLSMKYLGKIELPSIICGNEVYFSVTGIFDFLKIRNIPSTDSSIIDGFIKDQKDIFLIDENSNLIKYNGKVIYLGEDDFIKTKTDLFLKSTYFSEIFGLHNTFNARFLAASMQTDIELPSIKTARREEMRNNLRGLQRDFTVDTIIQRDKPLFDFGAATWNINTNQRTDGFNFNRFNLGIGGLLAGGEFTGNFNYNTSQEFLPRNQFYQWRYVNNENKVIRQITAGKIATRSIATIFSPVIGVQVSNSPTYLKKSFGTYVLSDYTEPEWIVELYINNVLVDYVQADVTGFFNFDVPLMFGNTFVSLRYYGPWGEEIISNRNINIPFNFLPKGKLEYMASSGVVEDGDLSFFTQFRVDYGLSNRITIGGGMEILSSIADNPYIPFLETSLRLPYNVMLSAQYFHELGYKGNLTYVSPSNFRVDLNYVKYEEGQQVIPFSYIEERRANLTLPISVGKFNGTSRFIISQNLLPSNVYTNLEWLLTGRALGMRMNFTTTAFLNKFTEPFIFSRLSTSINLPYNIIFSPQVEYNYVHKSINAIRGELRKQLNNSIFLQASYDHNFLYDQYYLNLGFTLDFNLSRLGFTSSTSRNHTLFSQSISGNILYDPGEDYLRLDKRSTIGRGSIKFKPFLDLNGNGKREENERLVENLQIRSFDGGMKEKILGGSSIFTGLEPYINYHFKIETHNLERIAWRVEKQSLRILVNPNQVKVIEIPVIVVGEIAGYVLDEGSKGIGGIHVNIFDETGKKITRITSEGDGFINYLGLKSGNYVAEVDTQQLKNLDMGVENNYSFTIFNGEDGGYIDSLELLIHQN